VCVACIRVAPHIIRVYAVSHILRINVNRARRTRGLRCDDGKYFHCYRCQKHLVGPAHLEPLLYPRVAKRCNKKGPPLASAPKKYVSVKIFTARSTAEHRHSVLRFFLNQIYGNATATPQKKYERKSANIDHTCNVVIHFCTHVRVLLCLSLD